MAPKRANQAVGPMANEMGTLAPEQKFRGSTTETTEDIDNFRELVRVARCGGFVSMIRTFSMGEAEGIWKGIAQPKVDRIGLSLQYQGCFISLSNCQLAHVFQLPDAQDLPPSLPQKMLSISEATQFLRFHLGSRYVEGKVTYGAIKDIPIRKYVQFFAKWVMLKPGSTYATLAQLTYARSVMKGELHPLQVWKCELARLLGRTLQWPSLTAFLLCYIVREYKMYLRPVALWCGCSESGSPAEAIPTQAGRGSGLAASPADTAEKEEPEREDDDGRKRLYRRGNQSRDGLGEAASAGLA